MRRLEKGKEARHAPIFMLAILLGGCTRAYQTAASRLLCLQLSASPYTTLSLRSTAVYSPYSHQVCQPRRRETYKEKGETAPKERGGVRHVPCLDDLFAFWSPSPAEKDSTK
ncbi:unnamed protein product [Ectocarpus sp. 12 AP-2014]